MHSLTLLSLLLSYYHCLCVFTVIYASGTSTVLKFHARLQVLQMHYVAGIHPMAQHWLLGM